MDSANRLGDYLRARRELVTPDMVGLSTQGIRRVPGLRREEVAMLAGVSADYYLRLEQGRDRNPSDQVLDALARVLQLDETSSAYLHQLANPRPARAARPEVVPVEIAQLLEVIGLPAFIANRYLDVLAANPLVTALAPNVRVGENRLRSVVLDPAEQALHPDWERTGPRFVASFRNRVASELGDPRVAELVCELVAASPAFREAWHRHDVLPLRGEPIRMNHPQVGELHLSLSKLEIDGSNGLMVIIYHPAPGSRSSERLALLADLAAPVRRQLSARAPAS